MFKKRYIEKAKSAILNRVKFHAPVVFDDEINFKVLQKHGVDVRMPIFVFDKVLTYPLLKAFCLAQCQENFNLLFSKRSVGKMQKKVQQKLPNAIVFDEQSGSTFLECANKLNINYPSSSNYNLAFKDKFFKVNGQILNPKFEDFSLRKTDFVKNIFVDYSEFVLNGSNFFCTLKNKLNFPVRAEIELNIPLEKGYYYFKKMSHVILIENLLTKEKFFLNYFCRNAKFSFSDVDGLENSTFSCVNIKANLNLLPDAENFVFFNFGKAKFLPKNFCQIKKLKEISQKKSCEVFNLQVKTKNPKFDFFFNKTLPQKIWINWLNGTVDEILERKYVTYKKLFLKGNLNDPSKKSQGLTLVNFEKIGIRELGIFNGQYYKKIFVIKGAERFLKVGDTCFYHISGITKHSLTSHEPISVCFGQ